MKFNLLNSDRWHPYYSSPNSANSGPTSSCQLRRRVWAGRAYPSQTQFADHERKKIEGPRGISGKMNYTTQTYPANLYSSNLQPFAYQLPIYDYAQTQAHVTYPISPFFSGEHWNAKYNTQSKSAPDKAQANQPRSEAGTTSSKSTLPENSVSIFKFGCCNSICVGPSSQVLNTLKTIRSIFRERMSLIK